MKRFKYMVIGALVGGLIGLIFYRHLLAVVIFTAVATALSSQYKADERNILLLEFKEFLNGIHSELLVGQSFRHAIGSTLDVQTMAYEPLRDALEHLHKSISLGVDEVGAWQTLADDLEETYISEFVTTLRATYFYSGNVVGVIKHTIYAISDAIDLTLEMNVILISKKIEFLTMILLPIILLGILSITQYDYMAVLYESMMGRLVMTGVLIIMCIAYLIGHYIARIDV